MDRHPPGRTRRGRRGVVPGPDDCSQSTRRPLRASAARTDSGVAADQYEIPSSSRSRVERQPARAGPDLVEREDLQDGRDIRASLDVVRHRPRCPFSQA
jgi:hypothetical protein